MVTVQRPANGVHIDALLSICTPRQLKTYIQIIANHRRLRTDVWLLCQLVDLLFKMLPRLVLQLQALQLLTVLVDLAVLVLAKLTLKDPNLRPQNLLLLLLSKLVPDLALHLPLIAQHIPLPGQETVEFP